MQVIQNTYHRSPCTYRNPLEIDAVKGDKKLGKEILMLHRQTDKQTDSRRQTGRPVPLGFIF